MATQTPIVHEAGQDAITGEEIAGTTIPPTTPTRDQSTSQKRNACTFLPSHHSLRSADFASVTELLSSSGKSPIKPPSTASAHYAPSTSTTFSGRAGLGAYTYSPESFPQSRVISFDDSHVTINDLYPKSSLHLLLLPRHPQKQLLHPFEALQDPVFLASVQEEVRKLRVLAAKELKRRFGKYSAMELKREEAMEKALDAGQDIDESSLPPGRDWSKDVISGVHTHPSMSHLHIHILSVDRHSECMKHRKHYNSFATSFLVDVEEFPLSQEEVVRRKTGGWLDRDLVCWRCGRNFRNKFARLKQHLEEEFEEWKKE
ncbi:MAG: hypothetical protein Q9207_007181 [Kuettlingeria erythrocarpa]